MFGLWTGGIAEKPEAVPKMFHKNARHANVESFRLLFCSLGFIVRRYLNYWPFSKVVNIFDPFLGLRVSIDSLVLNVCYIQYLSTIKLKPTLKYMALQFSWTESEILKLITDKNAERTVKIL